MTIMVPEYVERWNLAQSIINGWWIPLSENDGVASEALEGAEQRLGVVLPAALRTWYGFAGHRQDFVGFADRMVAVERLMCRDGLMVFCRENQGCAAWGIRINDLALEDPPVMQWLDDDSDEWKEHCATFSEFMTEMLLRPTIYLAQFSVQGAADAAVRTVLERYYSPLFAPTAYLGTVLCDAETLIWWYAQIPQSPVNLLVAARSQTGLERFRGLVGAEWGSVRHRGKWWIHPYRAQCKDVAPPCIVSQPMQHPLVVLGEYPPCHLAAIEMVTSTSQADMVF